MPVAHFALQHVDELKARVLEKREVIGLFGEFDHVGLNDDRSVAAAGVAQQPVLVAGAGAAPVDMQSFPRLDENGGAAFLETAEEGADGDGKRVRQHLQCRQ